MVETLCFFCMKEQAREVLKMPSWPEPMKPGTALAICKACSLLTPYEKASHVLNYVNDLRKINNRQVDIAESN